MLVDEQPAPPPRTPRGDPGPLDADDVFLGPVITAAPDRALAATARMRDRYETIVPRDALNCEELFAPMLTVEAVENGDEAVNRANETPYGLACSVDTAMVGSFDRLADDLDVGICNWDRGTVGSSSRLPIGGIKNSWNHRSAGLFSGFYRVGPVAEIRLASPPSGPLPPGFRTRAT